MCMPKQLVVSMLKLSLGIACSEDVLIFKKKTVTDKIIAIPHKCTANWQSY